jgi:hypothetical protein
MGSLRQGLKYVVNATRPQWGSRLMMTWYHRHRSFLLHFIMLRMHDYRVSSQVLPGHHVVDSDALSCVPNGVPNGLASPSVRHVLAVQGEGSTFEPHMPRSRFARMLMPL